MRFYLLKNLAQLVRSKSSLLLILSIFIKYFDGIQWDIIKCTSSKRSLMLADCLLCKYDTMFNINSNLERIRKCNTSTKISNTLILACILLCKKLFLFKNSININKMLTSDKAAFASRKFNLDSEVESFLCLWPIGIGHEIFIWPSKASLRLQLRKPSHFLFG